MTNLPNTTTNEQQPEAIGTTYHHTESLQMNTANAPEEENMINAPIKKELVNQVGQLTRTLHNSLRELGFDKRLEEITAEVPEAQDKLSYIAVKTEQAAGRVLDAAEKTMPIQNELSSQAIDLSKQWNEVLESQQPLPPDTEKFKDLLIQTLAYLNKVPKQTETANSHLIEIIMAQDFQDLTGQVIKSLTRTVQDLEVELLQLLVTNTPNSKKDSGKENELMNGPVTNPNKSLDTVNDQNQVDDLLANLGF